MGATSDGEQDCTWNEMSLCLFGNTNMLLISS